MGLIIISHMAFLRKFLIELVVVAVIVGWAVAEFPEVLTLWIPWLSLLVVWHLVWENLPKDRIKDHFSNLQGKRKAARILLAVLIVVIVSGAVIWGVRVGTRNLELAEKSKEHNKVHDKGNEAAKSDRPSSPVPQAGTPESNPQPALATRPVKPKPNSPSRLPPTVSMRFFIQADELRFSIWNGGDETAQNPKYTFGLANFTNQYYPHYKSDPDASEPLPIPTNLVNDYVKPHVALGNFAVLNDLALQHVKRGDRLFGMATISCMNCPDDETVWLYWEVGHGGWYAPISQPDIGPTGPFKGPSLSNEQIDFWLSKYAPIGTRTAILPMRQ